MNILLLCKRHYTGHDLLDDKFGRLYHFPLHWASQGHEVKVIAADYRSMRSAHITEQNLHFVAAPLLAPRGGFARELRKSLTEQRPDLVIASCDSHFGFIGLNLARRLGVPFVFDLYHNYEDFGSNRLPGMRKMYQRALKGADLVVCDSEALAARVKSRCQNVYVAPQATDDLVFRPLDRITCRRELGFEAHQRILVYVGNIDSRFDRDALLNALDELPGREMTATLLVAGPGLDRKTRSHPLVHYLGPMPQSQIPRVIACADLCLIPYRSTPLAETCNPCKLSEYIACDRPIVASDVSNISQYLPKSGHLCYRPSDAANLLESISRQLTSPILEDRNTALLWGKVGESYLSELEKLTGKQTSP